jgi:hypothetical protein
MPNDAKFGLVLGVGVVVAVAVIFFRKESAASPPLAREATAASVSAPKAPPEGGGSLLRPVRAKPTVQGAEKVGTLEPVEDPPGAEQEKPATEPGSEGATPPEESVLWETLR